LGHPLHWGEHWKASIVVKALCGYQNAVTLVTIEVPSQRFLFNFPFFRRLTDGLRLLCIKQGALRNDWFRWKALHVCERMIENGDWPLRLSWVVENMRRMMLLGINPAADSFSLA
jgi:hypothetical protein